jgi:hypothetical protein
MQPRWVYGREVVWSRDGSITMRLDGPRWVVPETARSRIVFYHHDNVGHFGTEKMLQLVGQKFWFPQMKKYIERYVLLSTVPF